MPSDETWKTIGIVLLLGCFVLVAMSIAVAIDRAEVSEFELATKSLGLTFYRYPKGMVARLLRDSWLYPRYGARSEYLLTGPRDGFQVAMFDQYGTGVRPRGSYSDTRRTTVTCIQFTQVLLPAFVIRDGSTVDRIAGFFRQGSEVVLGDSGGYFTGHTVTSPYPDAVRNLLATGFQAVFDPLGDVHIECREDHLLMYRPRCRPQASTRGVDIDAGIRLARQLIDAYGKGATAPASTPKPPPSTSYPAR